MLDKEKEKLQNELRSIPVEDEKESWEVIQRLQVLNAIRREISNVLKDSSSAERIVSELREELGDNWYNNWGNLAKDTNNIQRYLVGIAYELVCGRASAKNIIGWLA